MSSCAYDNNTEILTCEEKIAFDESPDSWPFFCIELTSILIQRDLLELFSPSSSGGCGKIPPNQHFQSVCMEMVLNVAVNNLSLRCVMHEENIDVTRLWSWLKVRYESSAKLYPLKNTL